MSQSNPTDSEVNVYAQEITCGKHPGDQVKAWRVTFPLSKAKVEVQHIRASEFNKIRRVQVRILELANIAAQKADEVYGVTAEQLVGMLLETRGKAMDDGQYGPSVSAVTGISKMCGFDVSKLELTGKGGEAIKTESTFNFIPVGPKD